MKTLHKIIYEAESRSIMSLLTNIQGTQNMRYGGTSRCQYKIEFKGQ